MYKKFGGVQIEDVVVYAKDYLAKNPDVKIFVGTDSSVLRSGTLYATAICFYHPGNGAHVVFERKRKEKCKDLFTRLWNETMLSLEVALSLRDAGIEVTVDLDINPDLTYKSNQAHDAAVGLMKGYQFNVRTKPEAFAATCAADLLCKD